jgi:heptosyltransferase I
MGLTDTRAGGAPGSVCIVMLSALGDAVHVLPVANALKRHWPETRISWVIQPPAHRLVAGHRSIDDFLVFHRRRGVRAWESYRELARRLPPRPYDLVLALQVYLKAGLVTALVPGRVKLGFDATRARDLNWLFTNERIPFRGQRHVQDQYFEFLEHLGLDPHPAVWDLPITDDERAAQRAFFGASIGRRARWSSARAGAKRIGTRPATRACSRRSSRITACSPSSWAAPSRAERGMRDEIVRLTRARPLDLLGDDLRRLVWLIDGSALVISPDTGPLHIARALEVPVVGLFGYTNPKRTGPYQRFQDLVVDGYARFPGEAYPIGPECRDGMRRVSVEAVLTKVSLAISRYPR